MKQVPFRHSQQNDYLFDYKEFTQNPQWKLLENSYDMHFLGNPKRIQAIPKIIHQIWLGGKLPAGYRKFQRTWKDKHPDWQYKLWTDEDVKSLVLINEDIFRSTDNVGAKSDILRYELLYRFGGLYVDTDFECLHRFDYLHEICHFYAGIMFGPKPLLCNCIIASEPQHPILKSCIDNMKVVKGNNGNDILNITGPVAFTKSVFEQFETGYKVNLAMPVSYFFPYPNNMLHINNRSRIMQMVRPESLAIHYWHVSWSHTGMRRWFSRNVFRYIPNNTKKIMKELVKPK